MHCTVLKTPPCFLTFTTKLPSPNPRQIQLTPRKQNPTKTPFRSLKCIQIPNSQYFSSIPNTQNTSSLISCSSAGNKLQCLVSEFKSLSQPIDRVKRLLQYAALLPRFDESARLESNRVKGCTTQVWLEAKMDSKGLMRFRADSDSEITKGFCSCLIWVLDGAVPDEVLAVRGEDLVDMNVGLSGRAHSRVNTWHNVLTSMQKRTKTLVEEREGKSISEPFSSLMVTNVDDINGNGTHTETQERLCTVSRWIRKLRVS
ncbi:unnamed protein product [Camellia sinensis]